MERDVYEVSGYIILFYNDKATDIRDLHGKMVANFIASYTQATAKTGFKFSVPYLHTGLVFTGESSLIGRMCEQTRG